MTFLRPAWFMENSRWDVAPARGQGLIPSFLQPLDKPVPMNGTIEIAGPDRFRLDELIRRDLAALNDPREVISDSHARFFGGELSERTLVPDHDARLSETRFESWLSHPARQIPNTSLQPAAGTGRREQQPQEAK